MTIDSLIDELPAEIEINCFLTIAKIPPLTYHPVPRYFVYYEGTDIEVRDDDLLVALLKVKNLIKDRI